MTLALPSLLLALLVLTAGCGDDGETDVSSASTTAPGASTSSSPTTASPSTPAPGTGGTATTAGPAPTAGSATSDERVDAARRDLVSRFGYEPSAIRVVSTESVTWPNAALGCPETDKQYTQATVEGYRIVLAWKDVTFSYHGRDGELPFLCQFLER